VVNKKIEERPEWLIMEQVARFLAFNTDGEVDFSVDAVEMKEGDDPEIHEGKVTVKNGKVFEELEATFKFKLRQPS